MEYGDAIMLPRLKQEYRGHWARVLIKSLSSDWA